MFLCCYTILENTCTIHTFRDLTSSLKHVKCEWRELKKIEEKEITIERLALVRDLFLFSCYTGFAYIDIANLATSHIKIGMDEKKWLIKNRQKTDISGRVPILPIVERIITRYSSFQKIRNSPYLLPVPSNQKLNAYLKKLADICGITTKITFHIARHTFATTVTLENGVPIDSVSKMLGHRSIKTTQIYARVTDKKISDDTKELHQKLLSAINSCV